MAVSLSPTRASARQRVAWADDSRRDARRPGAKSPRSLRNRYDADLYIRGRRGRNDDEYYMDRLQEYSQGRAGGRGLYDDGSASQLRGARYDDDDARYSRYPRGTRTADRRRSPLRMSRDEGYDDGYDDGRYHLSPRRRASSPYGHRDDLHVPRYHTVERPKFNAWAVPAHERADLPGYGRDNLGLGPRPPPGGITVAARRGPTSPERATYLSRPPATWNHAKALAPRGRSPPSARYYDRPSRDPGGMWYDGVWCERAEDGVYRATSIEYGSRSTSHEYNWERYSPSRPRTAPVRLSLAPADGATEEAKEVVSLVDGLKKDVDEVKVALEGLKGAIKSLDLGPGAEDAVGRAGEKPKEEEKAKDEVSQKKEGVKKVPMRAIEEVSDDDDDGEIPPLELAVDDNNKEGGEDLEVEAVALMKSLRNQPPADEPPKPKSAAPPPDVKPARALSPTPHYATPKASKPTCGARPRTAPTSTWTKPSATSHYGPGYYSREKPQPTRALKTGPISASEALARRQRARTGAHQPRPKSAPDTAPLQRRRSKFRPAFYYAKPRPEADAKPYVWNKPAAK